MNVSIIYNGKLVNIKILAVYDDSIEWEDADNPKNFTDIEESELFAIEDLIVEAMEAKNKDLELEENLSNMRLN